jgi:hypothetical protein
MDSARRRGEKDQGINYIGSRVDQKSSRDHLECLGEGR